MKKQIKGFNLKGAPNANHLMFNMMVSQRAQADEVVMAHFAMFVTPYEAAVQHEDHVMNPSTGSELTPQIEQGDKNRDATYDAFERIVEAYMRYPNEATQADAKRLKKAMIDNKVNVAAQYDRETGQIMNLIQDLEANYVDEVEHLHLTPMVNRLKAENDEVYRLLNERDVQNSEKALGVVREARKKTDEYYLALKNAVNSYAFIDPSLDLDPFIDSVNYTIDRLNLQVFKITGSSSNKPDSGSGSEEDSEDSEEDNTGGGNDNTGTLTPDENPPGQNPNPNPTPGEGNGENEDEYTPPDNDGGFGKAVRRLAV